MKKIILFLTVFFSFITTSSAYKEYSELKINDQIGLENRLNKTFEPDDLVRASDYGIPIAKDKNNLEMSLSLQEKEGNLPKHLRDLMYKCEVKTGEITFLRSGYRSYRTQNYLFNKFSYGVAIPGTSEHQSGLCADINIFGKFMDENSKTFKCYNEEAWKYGFILSFPKGNRYLGDKSMFEPWHRRYVGTQTSKLIHHFKKEQYPAQFLNKIDYFEWLFKENIYDNQEGINKIRDKYGVDGILKDKELRKNFYKLFNRVRAKNKLKLIKK